MQDYERLTREICLQMGIRYGENPPTSNCLLSPVSTETLFSLKFETGS